MDVALTATLAVLASDAYVADDGTPLSARLPNGFQPYDIGYGAGYGSIGLFSQFFVALNPNSNQIVLSIRGTESGIFGLPDFFDLLSDGEVAFGFIGLAASDLQPVVERAKQIAEQNGYQLYITGHSL